MQYGLQLPRHPVPPQQKGVPTMGHTKERKGERTPDPILKLRHALLEAIKVMEKEAVEKDGKPYAPKVSIWWEILDDKSGGGHNGTRFWDNYSFVKSFDDEKSYVIREGTRIGDLAAFVAYEFEEVEGAQVIASLEPRRFKEEPPTGTRTVSSTLMLAEKETANLQEDGGHVEGKEAPLPDAPF